MEKQTKTASKELPLFTSRLYPATVEGFKGFQRDLQLIPHIGYDLVCAWNLGTAHFSAAFRLKDSKAAAMRGPYEAFSGEDEFFGGEDEI